MFENLFKNMQLSAIGTKVVDDTEDFTVRVYVPPPPPEEGKAVITKVEAPETFEPNKTFPIRVTFRNDGGGDYFFVRIINRDTGENIHELRVHLSSGTSWTTYHSINISQGTDFHCRAEAGHEE